MAAEAKASHHHHPAIAYPSNRRDRSTDPPCRLPSRQVARADQSWVGAVLTIVDPPLVVQMAELPVELMVVCSVELTVASLAACLTGQVAVSQAEAMAWGV